MTAPIRALIADDEPKAREKLERLLRDHGDIVVVASAANGREVVASVRATRPDVVFLDIRMPNLDGFQALAALRAEPLPYIVFVTAFDQYASRAFEVRALDYLLKPYDTERLAEAISRVRERVAAHQPSDPLELSAMTEELNTPVGPLWTVDPRREVRFVERLCIRSLGRLQVVSVGAIEWIEAYGNYVRLHTTDGHPLLRESLRRLLDRLDPARFARIHRSAVVRIDCVRELKPTVSGDYIMTMSSGTRLKLSRSFRAALEEKLEGR